MKSSRFKLSTILIAVLLLLVFLYYLGGLGFTENILTKIFNPITGRFYSWGQGVNDFYYKKVKDKRVAEDLLKENEELEEKYQSLLKENAELKILAKENELLKKELKFSKERGHQIVPSRVISRDLFLPNTLTIDKGAKDGLVRGLPIIAEEGVIVGKIIKVKDNSSTVLLLTDVQSKLAVMSLDDQDINGILRGEHGLSLKMELIPKNKELRYNEIIVTSGIETNIPPGLLVGTVSQITNLSGELFQSAILSPLGNYHNIKFVLVILP